MKTCAFALGALMLPMLAQAELSSLQIQLAPGATTFTKQQTLDVTAAGDGTGMEYQFTLERSGRVPVKVLSTQWGSSNSFEFDFAPINVMPGNYQLSVQAREAGQPKVVMENSRRLLVQGSTDWKTTLAGRQEQVRARYLRAQEVLRQALRQARSRTGAGPDPADMDRRCNDLASAVSAIDSLINPLNVAAPGGGTAYVDSVTGNAVTGAIGVQFTGVCASSDDFSLVEARVSLPAYPAGNPLALTAESVVISYDNVWTEEEREKSRNLVRKRFAEAVATVKERFAVIKQQQALRVDPAVLDSECMSFSSAGELARSLLNPGRLPAPGGGPAFSEVGANAGLGSIGVEMALVCMSSDNFNDISVQLTRPTYLGLPPYTVTLNFSNTP